MSEQPVNSSPGRRANRTSSTGRRVNLRPRRIDLMAVLGVVLPAIVAFSLAALGHESTVAPPSSAPSEAALSSVTVVCPPAIPTRASEDLIALRTPDADDGAVEVRRGSATGALGEPATVDVPRAGVVVLPDSSGVVTLDGQGAAAPGLVAGRRDLGAAPSCRTPGYDEWFLGGGASARSASSITLANPDPGQAVVNITLVGKNGPFEEPDLRDVPVPGESTLTVDLAKDAPRRAALAIHVAVTRGRVATTVEHTWDPLGRGQATTDSLPAQAAPATDQMLLGAARFGSSSSVYLANPGDDEVRATFRVLTEEAVFTPADAGDVAIPPHSMKRVRLDSVVDTRSAKGMIGLEVASSGPILATLRGIDRTDLVAVGAAPALSDPAAVVVPAGRARLLLVGERKGTVRITGYDADGAAVLDDRTVQLASDRAAALVLDPSVVAITLDARGTPFSAAILSRGPRAGTSVVTAVPSDRRAEIPAVSPR